MPTNDRAGYEASLALPYMRRVPGASLEAIVRFAARLHRLGHQSQDRIELGPTRLAWLGTDVVKMCSAISSSTGVPELGAG